MTEPSDEYLDILPSHPEPHRSEPNPTRTRARALLLALVAALLVVGVIGSTVVAVQKHQAGQRREAAAAAKKQAAEEHAQAVESCEDEIGDYVESLAEIDARLDVGVSADDLSDLAGDASVEESRVDSSDLGDLPEFCQDAKDEADDALDAYARTASDWNDCIWDDWCDPDSDADLDVQGPWADAEDAIANAEVLMSGEDAVFTDDDDSGETT